MKNKNGYTIIELIGALVILGIIISMLTMLISFFLSTNNKISMSTQANYESTLLIRTMTKAIENLGPTAYDTCTGDKCLILQKEYEYEYNELNDEVALVVYGTPEEYRLAIDKNVLYINDIAYTFDGFTLSDDSQITYQVINQDLYINMILNLVDGEGNVYEYTFSYSYALSDIPQ